MPEEAFDEVLGFDVRYLRDRIEELRAAAETIAGQFEHAAAELRRARRTYEGLLEQAEEIARRRAQRAARRKLRPT
jgi:hypothetical protein